MVAPNLTQNTSTHSYLSSRNKQREDDGAHPDAKHSVDEEATKETEDHIGPGVPGIEAHEGAL
jgi:hypothetical protein